jgi:hypothetical protein
MPTTTIEDNLFYSSIKLMPSFSEEKKDLTAKYTAKSMINLFLSLKNDFFS